MEKVTASTECGIVQGEVSKDYHGEEFYSFKGIPYARAPVGELRFMPPQPPEPWKGTRDATKDGEECPQPDLKNPRNVTGTENNCLNLNVFTKQLGGSPTKPVMVFIHGGGFTTGSNRPELYGPQYLMTQDVVLVVINYRVGVFGFLSLKDRSLGVPGNNGLKDQILALKWVQGNISSFGGDPDNVTVFGESAGGASLHFLILSPLAKGLFHKAIMQSGCALNIWAKGVANGLEIAKGLNYSETDEKSILERLRKEPAENITRALKKTADPFQAGVVRPYGPVIEYPHEGALLAEDPIAVIKSGNYNKVPMIFGYNNTEGIFHSMIMRFASDQEQRHDLSDEVPFTFKVDVLERRELAEKIKRFYYQEKEVSDETIECKYLLSSDSMFIHDIQRSINLMNQHPDQTIYAYRMSVESSLNIMKKISTVRHFKTYMAMKLLSSKAPTSTLKSLFRKCADMVPLNEVKGVSHADDLFYLFYSFLAPDVPEGSLEDKYVQRFVKLWTNFARYGKPTPQIEEEFNKVLWEPVEKGKVEPVFDIGQNLQVTGNLEKERMEFWGELCQKYEARGEAI